MKVIGCIPSRYASTRLPGKPLCDIGSKPMVIRVVEQAMQAKRLDDVVVLPTINASSILLIMQGTGQ